MSDYGADKNPDIPVAQDLAYTKGFVTYLKTNVMQWTLAAGQFVRKIASKEGKTNILFLTGTPGPEPPGPPPLDPVPAGNACTVCWGNGRPYGVGETPITVTVVIEGIEKTPTWIPPIGDPPDGVFELTQNIFQACTYEFNDINFDMDLIFTPGDATFIVRQAGGPVRSFFATGSVCATFFENEETFAFIGGTATIFIPPTT